ncbi:MAG TPA: PQQ-binding-like beta-propeller repeat protein [Planctomycetota bacterium]|nr:PQQ-binding-like beta-propeller repeat protein [Planctomycetota bacterium]
MWKRMVGAVAVVAWAGLPSYPARGAEGDASTLAREILAATGVRGGLVVHLGCGDGRLTAALHASESFLVHGLDADAVAVDAARKHIQSLGLYGPVAVDVWAAKQLPYVDNLVNLVVASDDGLATGEELRRVLAPGGVAYVRRGGGWEKLAKPRPREIDEWTHYLHDASNNAVAHDTVVGPPRHYQWIGGPPWSRHHDHMASTSAMVSADGRNFYIFDEGSTASIMLPGRWSLVARDAFNGTVLWKRPIAEWHTHLWPLKSGPAQLPRRLVAAGDRVYVTLGLHAPLSALDAATGETLRTFDGTQATEEILHSDGVLFLLVNEAARSGPGAPAHASVAEVRADAARRRWDEAPRAVLAVEAATGKALWKRTAPVVPLTLAADSQRVCFHDGEKLVALDRRDGHELWASPPITRLKVIPVHFAPTLVLYEDVVLFAGGENYTPHRGAKDKLTAVSAKDGHVLWSADHACSGYQSPEDVLVFGGLVWSGDITTPRHTGVLTGRDPRTGEVKSQFRADDWPHMPHHRCHRAKATDRYYLAGRTGVEFVDVAAKHWIAHHWVRGACLYGLMPCNGLLYTPPHDCACYIESKLNGFNALAATRNPSAPGGERLERGPAYKAVGSRQTAGGREDDWPMYRHDAARSGATKAAVPTELKAAWQAELGGKLSSVVAADGKVLVASVDAHTVHALDAASGKTLWSYTAGGRVDSPPTVWQGRVLFGSADGHVYCLRAADGALAWRFRAAPDDRRMTACDQVESVWPVHGSVLVHNDTLHCVAGRSMFLDGGLRMLRLDPRTGACVSETILDDRDPATGKDLQTNLKWPDLPVALPDVLSCDGRSIYMRSLAFGLDGKRRYVKHIPVAEQQGDDVHLFSPTGFLDDAWWHRSYWVFGRAFGAGYHDFFIAGRLVPAGRLLVVGDSTLYGYGRRWQYFTWTTPMEYHLFAAAKGAKVIDPARPDGRPAPPAAKQGKGPARPPLTRFACEWSKEAPVAARAMVLAGRTLFVAGPPDVVDEDAAARALGAATQAKLAEQAAAMDGARGALLLAVSAADGGKLAAYRLGSAPVFDGMAAANGRLFLSTTDGKVLCLAGEGQPLAAAADAELTDTPASRPAAPAPPSVKVEETTSHPDFQHLAKVRITPCDLGYRLQAPSGEVGFALRRLPAPLTKQATFRLRLRMLPNDATPLPPANAFLAFGDGSDDEHLVKCGLRSKAKAASVVQGPLLTGKVASGAIEPKVNQVLELSATVDLDTRKVTVTVLGRTVEAVLDRPLKSIAYLGYCIHSVASEFGPITVEGK